MSKAHRGKGIRDQFAHGRGECPVCKRNNIKILYEQEESGQKFKICKTCKAAIKNGNKKLPVTVVEPPVSEQTADAATVSAAPEPAETAPIVEQPASAAESPVEDAGKEEPVSEE